MFTRQALTAHFCVTAIAAKASSTVWWTAAQIVFYWMCRVLSKSCLSEGWKRLSRARHMSVSLQTVKRSPWVVCSSLVTRELGRAWFHAAVGARVSMRVGGRRLLLLKRLKWLLSRIGIVVLGLGSLICVIASR